MVVQSFVDQGALTRNVVALVERPADELAEISPQLQNRGHSPRSGSSVPP
jgi:hypothetical protein